MVTENSHREKFRIQVHPNFEKEEYKQAVDRMIRYIIEGDIYIANMTQQLTIESENHLWMFFMIFGKIIRLLSADIWISEIIRSSVHLRNVF